MKYLIYLITKLANDKKYVGQTQEGRLERRWHEHIYEERGNNRLLTNALNKQLRILLADGKTEQDLFKFFRLEVIETGIPEELIDQKETEYIAKYNSFYLDGHGYNMTRGGQGIHGYLHTEETKQRIKESNLTAWQRIKEEEPERYAQLCLNRSISNKGKPKSDAHKALLSKIASERTGEKNSFFGKHFSEESKELLREAKAQSLSPINAYNLQTGRLWKTFRFATEAIQELDLQHSANSRILLVCKEQKGHAYGYIWRYKTDFDLAELPMEIIQQETKTPRAKAVLQYDLENNFIAEFESAAAAARLLQPETTKQRAVAKTINEVCRGSKKTAYKFIWKYKD